MTQIPARICIPARCRSWQSQQWCGSVSGGRSQSPTTQAQQALTPRGRQSAKAPCSSARGLRRRTMCSSSRRARSTRVCAAMLCCSHVQECRASSISTTKAHAWQHTLRRLCAAHAPSLLLSLRLCLPLVKPGACQRNVRFNPGHVRRGGQLRCHRAVQLRGRRAKPAPERAQELDHCQPDVQQPGRGAAAVRASARRAAGDSAWPRGHSVAARGVTGAAGQSLQMVCVHRRLCNNRNCLQSSTWDV